MVTILSDAGPLHNINPAQNHRSALMLLLIAILVTVVGPIGYDHDPVDLKPGPSLDSLVSSIGEDLEHGIDPRRAVFLFQPIDLNLADVVVLSSLTGIGPKLAARIVSWRNRNGAFKSVSELLSVKGIGEKKLQAIIDEVIVTSISEEKK